MMIAPIAQVAQAVQTASNILPPDVATEIGLYIFILGGFLGYPLITRVPPLLHTPLMSATNAIAAISLVGSLVVDMPGDTLFSPTRRGGTLRAPRCLLCFRARRMSALWRAPPTSGGCAEAAPNAIAAISLVGSLVVAGRD